MIHFNANAEGASGVIVEDVSGMALLHKHRFVPRSIFTPKHQMEPPSGELLFGEVVSTWFDDDPYSWWNKQIRFKTWLRKSQRTTQRRLRFEANRRKG